MTGQTFGKYQLLKKLATGGMAEVWLSRQSGIEGFEKLCVVKRILPHLADDPEFVQMFLNEAKIAARFSHPNIAQIYDLGEVNGSYFIAMEHVHGEDLGRVMRKAWSTGQWLARPLAIRIVASACEGLYYAHTKTDERGNPLRVVHRDVSPQNILISFEGSVKLVDFGIAKAADAQSMTRSGAIKGKFAYMSPEQAAGKAVDHRSDLFAIGLVLYELLTGVRPLKRDSELATLQAALECVIEPPSKVADVPEELDPIVMSALARNADERYPDVRALQMALEEFLVSQRWVATSVQLAELMSALFQDRLDEEARLGFPAVGPEQASRPPTHPSSELSWDAPPSAPAPRGGRRHSQPSIAAPAPADVPAWEAPPGSEVPEPRRTRSQNQLARTASRPSNPAVRRHTAEARLRELQEEDDDEEATQLPDEVSGQNGAVGTGKSGQYSLRTARRPTREKEVPEAPQPVKREKAPPPRKSRTAVPLSDEVLARAVDPARRGRAVQLAAVALMVLAAAGAGFFWREAIARWLQGTANDGAEIFVSVDSNLPVELFVQHAKSEGAPEPLVFLGRNPLKNVGGVHVRDTLVFENKPLGLRYAYEIRSGQPGEHRVIAKDFHTGSYKLHFEPKSLAGLHLFIHDQEVGSYPGPKLDLVEGRHLLEVRGARLRQPAQIEIEVKPGRVTDGKVFNLESLLQPP